MCARCGWRPELLLLEGACVGWVKTWPNWGGLCWDSSNRDILSTSMISDSMLAWSFGFEGVTRLIMAASRSAIWACGDVRTSWPDVVELALVCDGWWRLIGVIGELNISTKSWSDPSRPQCSCVGISSGVARHRTSGELEGLSTRTLWAGWQTGEVKTFSRSIMVGDVFARGRLWKLLEVCFCRVDSVRSMILVFWDVFRVCEIAAGSYSK